MISKFGCMRLDTKPIACQSVTLPTQLRSITDSRRYTTREYWKPGFVWSR